VELTVATFNIYNSPTFDDRLPLILRALREADADVVCLQEVPPGRDLSARIATELGYQAWTDVTFVRPDDGWSEALTVLSRFRITDREPLDLRPGVPNCLRAAIESPLGSIDFYNTHLHPRDSELRQREAAMIMKRMEASGSTPAVLCGDFNAVPAGRTLAVVAGALRSAYEVAHGRHPDTTFPTPLRTIDMRTPGFSARREGAPDADETAAKAAIDYILVRQGQFDVFAAGIIGDAATGDISAWPSDHYGVWARLRLKAS